MRGRVKRREREISFSKATVLRREKKNNKNRMRGGGKGRSHDSSCVFSGLHRRAMTLLSLSCHTNMDDWINTVLCSDWMNLQTVITVLHQPQQSSTVQALPPDTELQPRRP